TVILVERSGSARWLRRREMERAGWDSMVAAARFIRSLLWRGIGRLRGDWDRRDRDLGGEERIRELAPAHRDEGRGLRLDGDGSYIHVASLGGAAICLERCARPPPPSGGTTPPARRLRGCRRDATLPWHKEYAGSPEA